MPSRAASPAAEAGSVSSASRRARAGSSATTAAAGSSMTSTSSIDLQSSGDKDSCQGPDRRVSGACVGYVNRVPDAMRAMVLDEFGGEFRLEQRAVPTPGHGAVLVKVLAVGAGVTNELA